MGDTSTRSRPNSEYEQLLLESYPEFEAAAKVALVRMFPQTVAHLVIVAFVEGGDPQGPGEG